MRDIAVLFYFPAPIQLLQGNTARRNGTQVKLTDHQLISSTVYTVMIIPYMFVASLTQCDLNCSRVVVLDAVVTAVKQKILMLVKEMYTEHILHTWEHSECHCILKNNL